MPFTGIESKYENINTPILFIYPEVDNLLCDNGCYSLRLVCLFITYKRTKLCRALRYKKYALFFTNVIIKLRKQNIVIDGNTLITTTQEKHNRAAKDRMFIRFGCKIYNTVCLTLKQ